jgi:polyvinyl alcohol dehydrogenase (cytochrome)
VISLFLLVAFVDLDQTPASPLGDAQLNYEFHCKSCHEPGQPGVPDISVLRKRSPDAIVRALESGKMKAMGSTLTPDERRAIAEFITQDQATPRGD